MCGSPDRCMQTDAHLNKILCYNVYFSLVYSFNVAIIKFVILYYCYLLLLFCEIYLCSICDIHETEGRQVLNRITEVFSGFIYFYP